MAITVSYTEAEGSPRETISGNKVMAVRTLYCDWDERITLAKELAGWVIGDIIHHPDIYSTGTDEGLSNLRVKSVDIEPVPSKDANHSTYVKAKLTVVYETPDYDAETTDEAGTTTYISESLEPATEFVTLSGRGVYFGTGAGRVALEDTGLEPPAMIIRMTDWVVTLHKYYTLPSGIWTIPGKVNLYSIQSRTFGKVFPAQTLLCGNPSLQREFTSLGFTAWTATFRFTYKPDGWNKFPRTDNASGTIAFENIYNSSDAVIYPYEPIDFSSILI